MSIQAKPVSTVNKESASVIHDSILPNISLPYHYLKNVLKEQTNYTALKTI